jgi:hypothetical protein
MTKEEITALATKVKNGTATQEEKVGFLKALSSGLANAQKILNTAKGDK